jgi:uncharacterized protein GlcG (DUF336 family)
VRLTRAPFVSIALIRGRATGNGSELALACDMSFAVADRVEAESLKQSVPVAVTVIDIHGNVVLTHRMTGAPAFSLELAERKAYTSALVGIRTADLVPLVQPGADLYPLLAVSGGRYSAMGGGVPLTHEDQVIAGVGVSGGTTEQDVAIVEAAMP